MNQEAGTGRRGRVEELEVQIPDCYDGLSVEDKIRWLDLHLSKDGLYEQIVAEADLPEKENTASHPFKKKHLLLLLLHLRGER